MKKMFMAVLLFLNFSIQSDQNSNFKEFLKEEFGKRYAGMIYWSSVGFKEIPGLDIKAPTRSQRLTIGERLAAKFEEEKKYLQCLRHRSDVLINATPDHVLVCGGNASMVEDVKKKLIQEQENFIRSLGWQLKSGGISIFPTGEQTSAKIEQVNQDGKVETKNKARIQPGQQAGISLPCKIIAVNVDKNSQVSEEELGVIAFKLLERDHDMQYDGKNYSVKMSVLTQEKHHGTEIKMSQFLPNRPEK